MGLFNYVVVESDVMPENLRGARFQTKDGPCELYMETYTITKEGRLMFLEKVYEWKPDEAKKDSDRFFEKYGGALKTKRETLIDTNYHGILNFYGHGVDCDAKFTDGNLVSITYGLDQ